ncbi:uncharacterized protein LOC126998849 isoform X3 [Eriocheir sinensis]|uniref:uncharacterized protein LOC126998849 isoform X3 n=1 Tax=Eriocheir sinensis TaxID=95602 RepID=UPI0021C95BEF|nr:uncharacterized protein LOC126998849 isoform X3 [Eriocheir sinensis]
MATWGRPPSFTSRPAARMRLSTTAALTTLVALVAAAPLPKEHAEDNLVEAHEEGLLLLVPTLPADGSGDKQGNDIKKEVEYELISIPKDVLRREVRQVAQLYGAPHSSNSYGTTQNPHYAIANLLATGAQTASGLVGSLGQTLSTVGLGAKQVLSDVVPAAAAGGAQAARWIAQNKANGVRTAVDLAGSGLRFAGQLSSSVLRVLLQVPGIKARVIAEIIRASQPLSYAISDVLAENSDELAVFLEAKNDIIRDALDIFIRLIQDTLAIKGKILARLGSSGLDIGAATFNAGLKLGGAFVESAGGIATAIGGGVGDLIRVGASADFPPPPPLPTINIASLLDLTRLFAPAPTYTTTLKPLPLPSKPAVTPAPSYSYDPPTSPSYSYSPPQQPSLTYGQPDH